MFQKAPKVELVCSSHFNILLMIEILQELKKNGKMLKQLQLLPQRLKRNESYFVFALISKERGVH